MKTLQDYYLDLRLAILIKLINGILLGALVSHYIHTWLVLCHKK